MRSLLGHACRAFTTIETYLAAAQDLRPEVVLHEPVDYFTAASGGLADPARVTQRGRDAGTALGDRAVDVAGQIVNRVAELVDRTSGDAVVATPLGGMRLIDYLPTRAFEVTVHAIDLARATRQRIPPELFEAGLPCLTLCATMASPDQRQALLLAATGRESLQAGFTVL